MRGWACGLILSLTVSACGQVDSDSSSPIQTAPVLVSDQGELISLIEVVGGLTRPVGLQSAGDGSGRLFVVEQDGRIVTVLNGQRVSEPFLLMSEVNACADGDIQRSLGFTSSADGNERGLLGLVFHPEFKANHRLFVNFTDGQGDTVVAEFTTRRDGQSIDPTTCRVIVRVDQPFPNHNGGQLAFSREGWLVIGLGDGGSGNDPCNYAAHAKPESLKKSGKCAPHRAFLDSGGNVNSRALLGKFLKLDIDHASPVGIPGLCAAQSDGSAAYSIPDGNVTDGCREVWSVGWRNPWRFSFDRQTGDLYVGDVGQSRVEEITAIPAQAPVAANYGWSDCEGDKAANGGNCQSSLPPWLIYEHHNGRCSITGGFVYRGTEAALQGRYIFGDYCTGEIFIAEPGKTGFSVATVANQLSLQMGISSFGEGEDGRIYVVFHGIQAPGSGRVFEIGVSQ